MKRNKKDVFKNTLKLARDKNPSANFTARVMQTIDADLQRERALKTFLQKEVAVGPSFNFTANVMAGIQANKPQFFYKPIIVMRAWYAIAALLLACVTIVALSSGAGNVSAKQSRVAIVIDFVTQIPLTYIGAMLVAVALLAADYLVGKEKSNHTIA